MNIFEELQKLFRHEKVVNMDGKWTWPNRNFFSINPSKLNSLPFQPRFFSKEFKFDGMTRLGINHNYNGTVMKLFLLLY